MLHSARCRSVSKRVCRGPKMPAGKISDHTTRCRRARANRSLQLYHCSSMVPASEWFFVPAPRALIAQKTDGILPNTIMNWKLKKQCMVNTFSKSFRNHFSRMPWVGAVWFDLTKFQIPSKLLTSLVSDSLPRYVNIKQKSFFVRKIRLDLKCRTYLFRLPWV